MFISKISKFSSNEKIKKNKQSFGTNYKGFPNFISVSINELCNLRCSYCPNSLVKAKHEESLFSPQLFKKFLNQLKEIEYDDIFCFHRYNEPLLIPDAEKYIEEVNKNIPNAKTTLYTNGMFLTKERLINIKNAGGIKTIIVTEHTQKDSFIKRLPEIDDELLKNIVVRRAKDINLVNRGGIFVNQPQIEKNLPCDMPKNNLCIDTKGKVVFCPDDYFGTNVVGDLNEQTVIEIVESTKFKDVSESLLKGERDKYDVCKNCNRTKSNPLTERILALEFKKMQK